ncbi:MAG: hypothetical protein K2J93_01870, partial [Anaeroplasmataceae bacterium]|nr:hypothetical protein [Anaeroplasmataceae bacterium]
MKRVSTLDLLEERCNENLMSLYHQFKEEVRDFFYKYNLFHTDNLFLKIFECLESKEYMSYQKISGEVAINVKG